MVLNNNEEAITGVILAGGLSRRMGGGIKSLKRLGASSILEQVISRANPQVEQLLLNVNHEASMFLHLGLPLIKDSLPGYLGPLAGVLAAMEWLNQDEHKHHGQWLASFPADSPFFPHDLVEKLYLAATEKGADIACASYQGRSNQLFALWSVDLEADLRHELNSGQRKVRDFQSRYRCVHVSFDAPGPDPFFNINTPEELHTARQLMTTNNQEGHAALTFKTLQK